MCPTKITQNRKICPTDVSDKNENKMQDMSDRTQLGKNKHVTEGHLTLFINTFPNFSQSISNNNDFVLHGTQAIP